QNTQHAQQLGLRPTRISQEKLKQVEELLKNPNNSRSDIAKKLKIAPQTIRNYFGNPQNLHLVKSHSKVNEEQLKEIKKLLDSGMTRQEISKKLKVSSKVIANYFGNVFKHKKINSPLLP
ncbi:MAG: helix-turn-helix domain-containing protein, partial [Waterburya sp.]